MEPNLFIDFLGKRRSVIAKRWQKENQKGSFTAKFLTVGIRVPDHGALKPWRLVVITGAKGKKLMKESSFQNSSKQIPMQALKNFLSREIGCREQMVIAVISSPVEHKSIPKWEMQLSAGAVCTTLLYAAQSLGYASQWLTEWYAYNQQMLRVNWWGSC